MYDLAIAISYKFIMEQNMLVWVNEQNEIIGHGEKMKTHQLGQLHRAYSVFIYDKNTKKILLQKRASKKYHSGSLWSNAYCSHPYKEETWEQAIQRGLLDELGISIRFKTGEDLFSTDSGIPTEFQFLDCFHYYSNYGNLSEHEMDYVFLFCPDQLMLSQISPNPDEIEDLKWMNVSEVDNLILKRPDDVTSWFIQAYQFVRQKIVTCFSD